MLFKGTKVEIIPIKKNMGKCFRISLCVHICTGKHIRRVLIPYHCTDALIQMGKMGLQALLKLRWEMKEVREANVHSMPGTPVFHICSLI